MEETPTGVFPASGGLRANSSLAVGKTLTLVEAVAQYVRDAHFAVYATSGFHGGNEAFQPESLTRRTEILRRQIVSEVVPQRICETARNSGVTDTEVSLYFPKS